jgi:hypothetical protein
MMGWDERVMSKGGGGGTNLLAEGNVGNETVANAQAVRQHFLLVLGQTHGLFNNVQTASLKSYAAQQ